MSTTSAKVLDFCPYARSHCLRDVPRSAVSMDTEAPSDGTAAKLKDHRNVNKLLAEADVKLDSQDPKCSEDVKLAVSKLRLVVNRQTTYGITQHRVRKSISQLDVREATLRQNKRSRYNTSRNIKASKQKETFAAKLTKMSIANRLLLDVWRRSRQQAKVLVLAKDTLIETSNKTKYQLHMVSNLFSDERRRNEALTESLDALKVNLETSMNVEAASRSNISTSESNLSSLKASLDQKTYDLNKLHKKFSEFQKEFLAVDRRLEQKSKQLIVKEAEVELLKSANENLNSKLNAMIAERIEYVTVMLVELDDKTAELAKAQIRIGEMKKKFEVLKNTLEKNF